MKPIGKLFVALVTCAIVLSGCTKLELGEDVNGFPSFTAWTTYGSGTSTYADLAAVANTISSDNDSQIRILTSDTAVGRLSPLRREQALMARTGDEYIFSFEGDEDFSHVDWGPQDIRMVWTPTAPHSIMVKANSGIRTPMDLKGKKVPHVTANPSVNNKLEAMLAYGGLTWDDVQPIDVSYSEQPDALQAGKIDALFQQVYGSSLHELANIEPTRWIELDPNETQRVAEAQKIAPTIEVQSFEKGAGQKPGETANGFVYPIPVVAYNGVSDSLVYWTARTFQEDYENYKNSTATTINWDLAHIAKKPIAVPFHDGTVKYLKEMNQWTPEAQEKQDQLISYGEELRKQWPIFLKTADSTSDLKSQWLEFKQSNHLSSVEDFVRSEQ